jgi:hypothetical protein
VLDEPTVNKNIAVISRTAGLRITLRIDCRDTVLAPRCSYVERGYKPLSLCRRKQAAFLGCFRKEGEDQETDSDS